MRAPSRRASEGSFGERARLYLRARRAGARIQLPFRLPHGRGEHPSRAIHLGRGAYLGPQAWLHVTGSGRIDLGEGTSGGVSIQISAASEVAIAGHTFIGSRVVIIDRDHDWRSWIAAAHREGGVPRISWDMTEARPIRIGSGCYIGNNTIVMPGVTIGDGVVVGANSVVTQDLPSFSLALGTPAAVIKDLGPDAFTPEELADERRPGARSSR